MEGFAGRQLFCKNVAATVTASLEVREGCWSFGSIENVKALAKKGRFKEAQDVMDLMDKKGLQVPSCLYVSLLQACTHLKALIPGKHIHAVIIKCGYRPGTFVGNTLLNMYAKCGSVMDACGVFNKLPAQNVVSWNIMIAAYSKCDVTAAFRLFEQMEYKNIKPDEATFVSILKACSTIRNLQLGKQIHDQMCRSIIKSTVYAKNALIDMYAKCGKLDDARQVFDKMPERDVVSWTAMIAGCEKRGHAQDAFDLFSKMKQRGVKPDQFAFVSVLKSCSSQGQLEQGKQIHADFIKSGVVQNIYMGNALIDMYAKCGSVVEARAVFDKMPNRDVVSWNCMLVGYSEHERVEEVFELFQSMKKETVEPDNVTFLSILNMCASLQNLEQGKQVHHQIRMCEIELDTFLGNALIDMYAKCRSLEDAHWVFDNMIEHDVISWTAIIEGHTKHGESEKVFEILQKMTAEGVQPDKIVFGNILNAYASCGNLEGGCLIHQQIIKCGFEYELFLGTTLINMYTKCGSMEDARHMFSKMVERGVVSWTAMIVGHTKHGEAKDALQLFQQMTDEGVQPDEITFVIILNAFVGIETVEQGRQIHSLIIRNGLESDTQVGNTLLDMYDKFESVDDAQKLFHMTPQRDSTSWNAMIAGFSRNGYSEKVFNLFHEMKQLGENLNEFTFVNILNVSASLAAVEMGKQIHSHLLDMGLESGLLLANALIDMYAKCGSVEDAHQVLYKMIEGNISSWNSLIAGYGRHGYAKEVLDLLSVLEQEGIKPDHITFVAILSACSHAGLVDEGHGYFVYMSEFHGITPGEEHYMCMVDLLGRAGHLRDAQNVIQRMPFQPSVAVWRALLGACKIHGDEDIGIVAVNGIAKLEQHISAAMNKNDRWV